MEMTTAKTVGVFFVIFGCFAILYPKIFHPMVVQMFGLGSKTKNSPRPQDIHPRERMPRPPTAGPGSGPSDAIKSHMRAGVHPGMRAAAEMKKQAAEQGGGGKGMMGMILPMYAVGIIVYLVYTMTKVFMKNKENEDPRNSAYGHDPQARFHPDNFIYSKQGQFHADLADDTEFLLGKKEKLEELEHLLAKAEDKKMDDVEMRLLKDRLAETESQMSRILQAMEHVQARVRDGIDAKIAESDAQKVTEEKAGLNEVDGIRQRAQPQPDSSPDIESYEVIDKSTNEKKKLSKGNLEATGPMKTDLNALDSESSGRESDDEDSECVGVDAGIPNIAAMGAISGGIGAGLGIGAAMSMSHDPSDPTDILGLDAREVEIVGSLANAFNIDEDEDDYDVDADIGDESDNDSDGEPSVETIGDGTQSEDDRPEGLRKRQMADKTDSS